MNLYAYCGDNPINATDPMGTEPPDGSFSLTIDMPVWDIRNGRETTIRLPLGGPVPQGYISMWELLPSSTATSSQVENKSGYMYADTRTPLEREMAGYRAAATDPALRPDERIAAQNAFLDTQWETEKYKLPTLTRLLIDFFRPRDFQPGIGGTSYAEQFTIGALNVASALRGFFGGRSGEPLVPRTGPKGVDPLHHNANVLLVDAQGNVVGHTRIVSGSMTPAEQALGFPKNTLASHTESRAIRQIPLVRGQTMTITGQRQPCPSCKGAMNRAAAESGATIRYRWWENGQSQYWTAGGN